METKNALFINISRISKTGYSKEHFTYISFFETFLFQGDVGDPVYYNNMLFGIISDIGDDTKPAIMIRPGIPESDYDFSEEQLAKRRKLKEK